MRRIERIKPIIEYIKDDFAESGEDNFIAYLITRGIIPEDFAKENDISYGEHINVDTIERVGDLWLKNQDLRFSQVLIMTGVVPNIPGYWFYKEDDELFEGYDFKRIIPIWGTYGKGPIYEMTIVSLKEMSISHMKNILKLDYASEDLKKLIRKEIKFRK